MPTFKITYYDEIEADTLEEAYKRLLKVLASDVKHEDVEAFKFEEIANANI